MVVRLWFMRAVIITQIIQLLWAAVVRVFPVVLSSNLGANKSLKAVQRFALHWTVQTGACFALYAPAWPAPKLYVRLSEQK